MNEFLPVGAASVSEHHNFTATPQVKEKLPEAEVVISEQEQAFDFENYRHDLARTVTELRRGDPKKGLAPDPDAAEQYLRQETIKTRYTVARELYRRKEKRLRNEDYQDRIELLISEYDRHTAHSKEQGIIGKDKFESADHISEPNYDILDESPIYPYEKNLDLSMADKKELLKKAVDYLRERGIFIQFAKTINDAAADNTKGEYLKLNEDGTRDLPIGELMGNKIIVNPWNVDFMSTFLTIGHLYGHLAQEMNIEEYQGIRKFLAYPKPLDMEVVQKEYAEMYGGRDYKADFKIFEEEAFAYAKHAFQEAGIQWTPALEHAMRAYIDTDFDELWEWSTQKPEKEAKSFMDRYETYYLDLTRQKYPELKAKQQAIKVIPNKEGNIKVVREGKI